ncbi:TlpA family protein disulfide reductase [Alicyclobacillus sp. SO9]|uniref:TlpA family protein disulfide reductase n=1 Tax=Alicyclobacillus sp. SO9 TaxID=2665646 RepID=UPI00351C1A6A
MTELNTNKKVSLNSLLARGHPVILNAFASWCAPCNKEAPELQKLSKQYQGIITFVGVDTMDTVSGVKKFVRKHNLTSPCCWTTLSLLRPVFRNPHEAAS